MKKASGFLYYSVMRNDRIFREWLPQPSSILEIRLCSDTWEKIEKVAWARMRSRSWVVRYALFRLIKRKGFSYSLGNPNRFSGGRNPFYEINEKAWARRYQSNLKHRHRLCLYGEDELFIRLAAVSLGCSITHLVRVALEKYLDTMHVTRRRAFGISGIRATAVFWFWLGIKMFAAVELPIKSTRIKCFHFIPFQKRDYF